MMIEGRVHGWFRRGGRRRQEGRACASWGTAESYRRGRNGLYRGLAVAVERPPDLFCSPQRVEDGEGVRPQV